MNLRTLYTLNCLHACSTCTFQWYLRRTILYQQYKNSRVFCEKQKDVFHQQITDKITTCSSELRPLFNFVMFSSIDKITTWSSELRLFSTLLCFHQQITDEIAICLSELRPFFYFVMFSSTDHKLYQFHHIMHQQITCDTHLSVFNAYCTSTCIFCVNIQWNLSKPKPE
jgi:hypothetical protein